MACGCGFCQKQLGAICPSEVIRLRMAQVHPAADGSGGRVARRDLPQTWPAR